MVGLASEEFGRLRSNLLDGFGRCFEAQRLESIENLAARHERGLDERLNHWRGDASAENDLFGASAEAGNLLPNMTPNVLRYPADLALDLAAEPA